MWPTKFLRNVALRAPVCGHKNYPPPAQGFVLTVLGSIVGTLEGFGGIVGNEFRIILG